MGLDARVSNEKKIIRENISLKQNNMWHLKSISSFYLINIYKNIVFNNTIFLKNIVFNNIIKDSIHLILSVIRLILSMLGLSKLKSHLTSMCYFNIY